MKPTVLLAATTICLGVFGGEAQQPNDQPVTSRQIDQLRREIYEDTRTNVEGLFEYRNETGDLNNRLNLWRYGARLNYHLSSGTVLSFRGVRSEYRTRDNVLPGNGTNFTGGAKFSFGESGSLRLEGGATRFNTESTTVNALAAFERQWSENFGLHFTASRSNVEESMLSATGVRPPVGPFAGQLVGQVMDNRFVGGARWGFLSRWDLFGEGGGGTRTGRNVESNPFRAGGGGVGFNFVSESPDESLSLLRAAYAVDYFGFDKNLFGFGGASLTDRRGQPIPLVRIGSDGLQTVASGAFPGVGGYFSPQNFLSNTGRLELKGSPQGRFEYGVTAFAGAQKYTGSDTRGAFGCSAVLVFHLSDRFSLPVSYLFDNIGPFRQQTVMVRLVARL
jgi:hypothetical protein